MLTLLLALGVFATGLPGNGGQQPSAISTPLARTILLSRTNGFTTASHAIDPYDVLNYEIDLSPLLEAGERFVSAEIAVLPASAVQGFKIPEDGPYGAFELDDRHIRIWPQIAPEDQGSAGWSGQGATCGFEVYATTDSMPPRKWQRTVLIRVAQR